MKDKPREYKIVVGDAEIKLYINGMVHLSLKRDLLIGFQAWELNGKFCVEYYMKNGNILTEYNKIDKWKSILKLLDESEIYHQ